MSEERITVKTKKGKNYSGNATLDQTITSGDYELTLNTYPENGKRTLTCPTGLGKTSTIEYETTQKLTAEQVAELHNGIYIGDIRTGGISWIIAQSGLTKFDQTQPAEATVTLPAGVPNPLKKACREAGF